MRVLYSAVIVFLLLAGFTAHSVWRTWQQRTGEARAAAIFDLVQQRTAARPTEAPGAVAWLLDELDEDSRHPRDANRPVATVLGVGLDRLPPILFPLADVLRRAGDQPREPSTTVTLGPARASGAGLEASRRRERVVRVGDGWLVATRNRALDAEPIDAPSSSNRFIDAVAPRVAAARARVGRELARSRVQPGPGDATPRPARVYAVAEDGTLISAPFDADAPGAIEAEARRLAARPTLPAFAPQEFFFTFDPAAPAETHYSGPYLDLGGRGLVATVTTPMRDAGGQQGILALDLQFDVPWPAFAASVAPPVACAALTLSGGDSSASWSRFAVALPAGAPATLRDALAELSTLERMHAIPAVRAPLHHALVQRSGAVAAFQVSDDTWLLALFPNTAPAFPLLPVALLSTLLVALLAGFEANRRRADGERRKAERALLEKQNLLNTMQVPLVVVDPNTDVLVSANRAAQAMGLRDGLRFADFVAPVPAARAHYERMQAASVEPRRAYGVPLRVHDESGQLQERYALVRSVAVSAPIEALSADERHRLAVLFLVDPVADLALFTTTLESEAHRDERRRLAGLLSHGVDTLARVLEHALARPGAGTDPAGFAAWLAEYLERRLRVTAWLLEHWDAAPPLPPESVIDLEHVQATVARLASVFERVRGDAELRSRLHWDNGTLAGSEAGPVLVTSIDWPPAFEFTCPVAGGVGFFLGEALTNAVRHGVPGSVPRLVIDCDRVRKALVFEVENATSAPPPDPGSDRYGGIRILSAMARLFGWSELSFDSRDGRFVLRWRVAAGARGRPGRPD